MTEQFLVEVHVVVQAENRTVAEEVVTRKLKPMSKVRGYENHYVADVRGENDEDGEFDA